jgi:surface antigen
MRSTTESPLAPAFILALCTLAVPTPSYAQGYAFLKYAPERYFQDSDWQLMQEAVQEALDTRADGESVQWANQATGCSGTVTALKAVPSESGKDCRSARIANRAPKATSESEHRFCRDEGGDWKVAD